MINGGSGTVTVNNTTGLQLVTNTINTGVTTPSVIEIVDQLKAKTTWYVFDPTAASSQQVSKYEINSVNANQFDATMLAGRTGTAGVQYAPQANMYYQWVDTATLDRATTSTQFDYGWTYTPNAATGQNWTRTVSLVSDVQQATGGGTTGQLQTSNFQEVVTATGSSHGAGGNTHPDRCCGSDNQYNWYQEIFDHLTLTLTNTVKASNPINIQFNGGSTSTVAVTSNSSIVLNGSINNAQGTTSLTATGANSSITVGANANNPVISGTSITFGARRHRHARRERSSRSRCSSIGGSLTANSTDHDISISAIGGLSINQVKVTPLSQARRRKAASSSRRSATSTRRPPYDVTTPS